VDGKFPPASRWRSPRRVLKVAGRDESKPVAKDDKAAVFEFDLPAGPTPMQTWFYDAEGKELCGAFYVTVLRKTP